ncbi:hypothetical protein [Aeromonas veronii]|uniref:hypothetical protein n=1 Tax=Aeromonas veronii TaxID=654 RepID=UPI00226D31B1|nr:hypothetical protein [Aeromonas veronii]MCX9104006.1 hypothetical protein [Aeromonas veronii]MCX9119657.1 hypothetical protein [Aeromonas veronii]
MKSYILKVVSAIAMGGEIIPASKPGQAPNLIEVSEAEAKNLLHRGKAVLATEEDGVEQEEHAESEEVELSKLSKIELLEVAKRDGIPVADGMTKAQIIEAIDAANAAASDVAAAADTDQKGDE